VVAWPVHDWVPPGLGEELVLACSPHRVAVFTAYLLDDCRPEHHAPAFALLPLWVRFCLGQGPVTGPAADLVLSWAERAAAEPAVVAADLGNRLNRPIDETSVTEHRCRLGPTDSGRAVHDRRRVGRCRIGDLLPRARVAVRAGIMVTVRIHWFGSGRPGCFSGPRSSGTASS
jgi:hypothetical protein